MNFYICSVCDVFFGLQPLPHIDSSQHLAKVFLKTIDDTSRFPALYSELPSSVRGDDEQGHLRRDGCSAQCTLCSSLQIRLDPLRAHLEGKVQNENFLKNPRKSFSHFEIVRPLQSSAGLSDHPQSPTKFTVPNNPIITLAEQKKHIRVSERKFCRRFKRFKYVLHTV